MNNAFIFDIDGVIIDSEGLWSKYCNQFLCEILSDELRDKMGSVTGLSVRDIYEKAVSYGLTMSQEEFKKIYDQIALEVYKDTEVTTGVEKLVEFLSKNNVKLGVVTSSKRSWINIFRHRVPFLNDMECIYLNDRNDLAHKPAPDGYSEMMRILDSSPETTTILEDSNHGITSAITSGAFTIAFTQNLVPNYKQKEADAKAHSMQEVIEIMKNRLHI